MHVWYIYINDIYLCIVIVHELLYVITAQCCFKGCCIWLYIHNFLTSSSSTSYIYIYIYIVYYIQTYCGVAIEPFMPGIYQLAKLDLNLIDTGACCHNVGWFQHWFLIDRLSCAINATWAYLQSSDES